MLVSSSVGKIGDQVTFLSPTLCLNESTTISFFYNMRLNSTDTTAALSLYAQSVFGVNFQQLFAAAGNRGPQWNSVEVCLPTGTYRLAFVATVGFPFMSDIALDNVILQHNSPCDVGSLQHSQVQQTGNDVTMNIFLSEPRSFTFQPVHSYELFQLCTLHFCWDYTVSHGEVERFSALKTPRSIQYYFQMPLIVARGAIV